MMGQLLLIFSKTLYFRKGKEMNNNKSSESYHHRSAFVVPNMSTLIEADEWISGYFIF